MADDGSGLSVKPRKIDIVFVLDVSGSMEFYIPRMARSLFYFGETLQKKGIKPRYCLVTFRNQLQQNCPQFVEDDPDTREDENLKYMERQLGQLVVVGGGDRNENVLAGLEAAAAAPWETGSQSIAIVITDGGFHFAPDQVNIGEGIDVPTYSHAGAQLVANGVNTYVVGPSLAGFSRKFVEKTGKTYPDLPTMTGGKWLDIRSYQTESSGFARAFEEIAKDL